MKTFEKVKEKDLAVELKQLLEISSVSIMITKVVPLQVQNLS